MKISVILVCTAVRSGRQIKVHDKETEHFIAISKF